MAGIASSEKNSPASTTASNDPMLGVNRRLEALIQTAKFQALGPDRVLEFPAWDHAIRMFIPYALTEAVQGHILRAGNFFEHRILAEAMGHISPGSTVLDAGANIGNHTIFFSKVCQAGSVHAFEPMRLTYSLLQRNIALNSLQNVTAHNAALGAEPGTAKLLSYSSGNLGMSSVSYDGGIYPVTTIDALRLERLDFVKIDVEGAHMEVLEGGRETLRRLKPKIWIELRPNRRELQSGDELLRSMGFRQARALSTTDFLYTAE